jgi:hypothetical protein
MKKKKKKKYVKPKITRIKLDAETAVLMACKVAGGSAEGPRNINCRGGSGGYCMTQGS